ncbi:MAG: DNA-binding transcriptional regulator CytR [Porticoccaceae bacterium]|nr:MAG: DNA-binding transcriptional regulator CytR [Porticoccaceae bacterium]
MPSIKDVARLAGVSVATVSRALSHPERVRPETRERVLAAVRETGYVANQLAVNLRRRRSRTAVVLVPDIANLYYARIVQEVEAVARSRGYQILLGETAQDPQLEQAYAGLVRRGVADGIISLGMKIPFPVHPRRRHPDPAWPPLVMIGEYTGGFAVPRVGIDNVRAGADATAHLVGLGHRRIAFLGGPEDFTLCQERLAGFRKVMAEAGLGVPPDYVLFGDFKLDEGYRMARHLFATCAEPPTALFCANDEIAMGAMKALRELAIAVPERVSLIGFDDLEIAPYLSPPLTTIHQPRRTMGRTAMEMLVELIEGRAVAEPRPILAHRLVVRDSTAPPPG